MLNPIGPGVPDAVRAVLKSFHEALLELQTPGAPKPVYACAAAELPAASDYPQCVALVRDLNILAHSDGVHWIRQDSGAVIA